MEGTYSNAGLETLEGKIKRYYNTGQLLEVQHYKKGKRNGEALHYSKYGGLITKGFYEDDLKFGKETVYEGVYLYKHGERELVYDYTEKNYESGKLEGKVSYFMGDSLVHTNSYKKGKPYNGIFYIDEKITEKYKEAQLQTVTANPHPYTVTEYYKNTIITEVHVTKENTKPFIGYYHLDKIDKGLFIKFDDYRFPLSYIIREYKDGVKNGLEKEIKIDDDLKENLINTKAYKNGILTKEIWHNYYVSTSQNVQGLYKDDKPYDGYFYGIEDYSFNISQYKKGIKDGQQYSGYFKELSFVKTDSITYKKGKPFQGNKATFKNNSKFLQQYEKGEVIKTEILDEYDNELKATVTYLANGIVVKDISGKVIGELFYLDKTKEKAKVIVYKDFKKIGTLEYDKNKITALDIVFLEGGLDLKYYINKENAVTIKVKEEKYYMLIYPNFERDENFTFIDFLDDRNIFMGKHYDAKSDFYLDGIEEPISSCFIKKGRPFNGTVMRYNEEENTYEYNTYKDGKRSKKGRELSKQQLITILKWNK